MNKIYVSYFWCVRILPEGWIPISTSVFPPKYFGYKLYLDKRNILNGAKSESLIPGPQLKGLCEGQDNCICDKDYSKCAFLKGYREQLDKIDIKQFLSNMDNVLKKIKEKFYPDLAAECVPVLMVHEAFTKGRNMCSEGPVLVQWLKDNGVDVEEFDNNTELAAQQKNEKEIDKFFEETGGF